MAEDGQLRLVISSPHILRIFAITGNDRVILQFASWKRLSREHHGLPTGGEDGIAVWLSGKR